MKRMTLEEVEVQGQDFEEYSIFRVINSDNETLGIFYEEARAFEYRMAEINRLLNPLGASA